ncbi:MAG: PQQ-dependent sugar dehydrogenase [Thermotogae bacterium]|nr:PQQ-dependent sugar dehydrogenase [Thermotogota bacterium]
MLAIFVAGNIVLKEMFEGKRFLAPVFMLESPTERGKFYIVQQMGLVRLVDSSNGKIKGVFDMRKKVTFKGEMGLLSMVLHPAFPKKPYVYIYYIDRNMNSVLSEFRFSGGRILPNSERVLLKFKQPYSNHNGGQLLFGPDGFLYLGLGDGGWAGDPHNNAQDTTTLLGALLRIDVNTRSEGKPYGIPPDNPFSKSKTCKSGCPEIYAWGLRNPWRFSFDRERGTLWLADVGQDKWEEIDTVFSGGNYGWRCYEGNHPYNTEGCGPRERYVFPIHEYGHGDGNCSITGGYVYRGKRIPDLYGAYIFGDFCSGRIWTLRRNDHGYKVELLLDTDLMIPSFAEDREGEIYVLDYRSGKIYRLELSD